MALSGAGVGAGAIRAGRAFVELFADDTNFFRALNRVKRGFGEFAEGLKSAGTRISAGGGAVLAGIGGIFAETVTHVTELDRAAAKLNLPIDKLSGFAFAAKTTGQSLEDLLGHWENFADRVVQGATGTGGVADAFKELGVDARQLLNQDSVDQMLTLADAFSKIQNRTKALSIASTLGGDQFQKLLPLFDKGSAGIREVMGKGNALGAVITPQMAADVKAFQEGLTEVKTVLGAVSTSIAGAFLPLLPAFRTLANLTVGLATSFRSWASANQSTITGVAAAAAAAVVAGGALVAIGVAISGVISLGGTLASVFGVVATIVGSTFAAITSPIGLAIIAAAALAYEFTDLGNILSTTFASAVSAVKGFLGDLFNTATMTWSGISDALQAGNIELAGKIAFTGLQLAFSQVVGVMKDIWTEFSTWFLSLTAKVSGKAVETWRSSVFATARALTSTLNSSVAKGIVEQLDQMEKEETSDASRNANAAAQALATSYAAAKQSSAAATAELQAELNRLVAQAAALPKQRVTAGGTSAPDPGKIGLALGDAVRGSFAGGTTQRNFAFGDKVGVSAIADSTAKTANATQSIDAKIKGGGLVFGA